MDQILDRLWLGTVDDAAAYTDPATQAIPLASILTLNEAKPPVAAGITHIHAPIRDEVYLPGYQWAELLHALQRLIHAPGIVLVHCRLGVSRAPSLVAAYLARCGHSRDLATALAYLVARRGCVAPHQETWRSLVEYYDT